MPDEPEPKQGFTTLATNLEALASPPRLEILSSLRSPQPLHEIRVGATFTRKGETPDRVISRQAVSHHLEQLQKSGLVRRFPAEADREEDLYVLNHQRLFALIDELRGLARLRPERTAALDLSGTLPQNAASESQLPLPPRLVVTYGRDHGVGYSLNGPVGAKWRLGRSRDCEVCLDYDPFVSGDNSVIERDAGGYVVRDTPANRNGTQVNWTRLAKGESRRLNPGDVVGVGRSLLVFQA